MSASFTSPRVTLRPAVVTTVKAARWFATSDFRHSLSSYYSKRDQSCQL